jgi:hypothetical protein
MTGASRRLDVSQACAAADALLAQPAANQRAQREAIERRTAVKPLGRAPAVIRVVAALFAGSSS